MKHVAVRVMFRLNFLQIVVDARGAAFPAAAIIDEYVRCKDRRKGRHFDQNNPDIHADTSHELIHYLSGGFLATQCRRKKPRFSPDSSTSPALPQSARTSSVPYT